MPTDAQSMLMQFLAARTGVSPEDSFEELMARMSANPQSKMLLDLLRARQTEAAERGEAIDEDSELLEVTEEDLAVPEPSPRRAEQNAQLRAIKVELEMLRERSDALAAGLGACYLCWGVDPACPECGGRGRPGWRAPDRKYFRELIVPAVHRWRQQNHPRSGETSKS
jgi:hypothetical protein